MNKIGGSARVREELTQALVEGRGVTAKVRWVSKVDEEGRNRWIHCTPLLGSNSQIGVWMVVIVDDDKESFKRWRQAPPVEARRGKLYAAGPEDYQPAPSATEALPQSKSPGLVRTYNHSMSLDSDLSLSFDRPPFAASTRQHKPALTLF